jgi:hypothetical protein
MIKSLKTLLSSAALIFIAGLTFLGCSDMADSQMESDITSSIPTPTMPNVVCMTLQQAQDTIQDQGVFYSKSEDASGQGRRQVIDSNWIVIAQNITPGSPIDEGQVILRVLKDDELEQSTECTTP